MTTSCELYILNPELHSSNRALVLILLKTCVKMRPPLKEQGVADELEPRCKKQACVVEHGLELVGGDVLDVTSLIDVWLEVDIGLDEEDIVN